VIEQGPNNFDVPTIVHPALFLSGLIPTSNATLFYQGVPESQLNDRQLVVPSGGTLGGGSSINLMMYSRAQRVDFDSWKTRGWSTKDMLPYLKKVCVFKPLDIDPSKQAKLIISSSRRITVQAHGMFMDSMVQYRSPAGLIVRTGLNKTSSKPQVKLGILKSKTWQPLTITMASNARCAI
jgi:choline dehydrogenase-like flavoprotein